jgi:hypothetical protein
VLKVLKLANVLSALSLFIKGYGKVSLATRQLINPLRRSTILSNMLKAEGKVVPERIAEVLFMIAYLLIEVQKWEKTKDAR